MVGGPFKVCPGGQVLTHLGRTTYHIAPVDRTKAPLPDPFPPSKLIDFVYGFDVYVEIMDISLRPLQFGAAEGVLCGRSGRRSFGRIKGCYVVGGPFKVVQE